MKKLKYLPSLLMLVLCVGILAVGVFAIKPQQNTMSGAITIHGSNEEIELTAYLNSVSEQNRISKTVTARWGATVQLDNSKLNFASDKVNNVTELNKKTVLIQIKNNSTTKDLGAYFLTGTLSEEGTALTNIATNKQLDGTVDGKRESDVVSARFTHYTKIPKNQGTATVACELMLNQLYTGAVTVPLNLTLNVEEYDPSLAIVSDGTAWLTGTDVPTNSLGETYDFYLDTDDLNIYKKEETGWQLIACIKGGKGDAGTSILSGTEVPSSTDGNNGDLFLNSNTYILYKKSNGIWIQIAHFEKNDYSLYYTNLFDYQSENNILGYYLSTNGVLTESSSLMVSHLIPVDYNSNYIYQTLWAVAFGKNYAYIHCYDENGDYIKSVNLIDNVNTNGTEDGTFATHADDFIIFYNSDETVRYIRLSVSKKVAESVMFVPGDEYPSEYIGYNEIVYKDQQEGILNYYTNLFNYESSDILVNKYLDNNGIEQSLTGARVTHLIPVEFNTKYIYQTAWGDFYGASSYANIFCYDKDGNYLKTINQKDVVDTQETDSLGDDIIIFQNTDENVKYIKLNVRKTGLESVMFTPGTELPPRYIAFNEKLYKDKVQLEQYEYEMLLSQNPLYKKSIAFEGDSICAGRAEAGNYAKYIAGNNFMTVTNNAVSGGTITDGILTSSGVERHSIVDGVENLVANKDKYDYIIFEGGVNDKSLDLRNLGEGADNSDNTHVEFGAITSSYTAELDKTTFCGAFEACCKALALSGKKVGYIFVHRIFNDSIWNESYKPTMIKILQKWGIPYLDLESLVPPLNMVQELRDTYTIESSVNVGHGDGWHPNELGYKTFYVDKITEWLKTL